MTRRQLYIHIGPHKTGTSTIQSGLESNTRVLARRGYRYPKVGYIYKGQHNVVFDINNMEEFFPELGGLNALVKYTHEYQGDVILSSETFDKIITKAPLEKLRDAFADRFDFTIIGYLRPQDQLLASYWQTDGRLNGNSENFNKWLRQALDDHAFLEYDKWLQNFEDIFGRNNLNIRIYSPDNDDLFLSFLKLCGLKTNTGLVPPARKNVSNPNLAFELFRQFHVDYNIENTERASIWKAQFPDAINQIESFLRDEEINLEYSVYSPVKLKMVRQKYRESNQRTAERYFNRSKLFLSPSPIKPSPKNLINRLTVEQAVKLGRLLIALERQRLLPHEKIETSND